MTVAAVASTTSIASAAAPPAGVGGRCSAIRGGGRGDRHGVRGLRGLRRDRLEGHRFGGSLDRRGFGRRGSTGGGGATRPLDGGRRHRRRRAVHLHRPGDERAARALLGGEQRRERVDQLGRVAVGLGVGGGMERARDITIVSASAQRSARAAGGDGDGGEIAGRLRRGRQAGGGQRLVEPAEVVVDGDGVVGHRAAGGRRRGSGGQRRRRGRGRGAVRRRGLEPGTLGGSASSRRTSAVATCGSNGFDSTPSMPRARDRASSTGSAAPVSSTTRMSLTSSGERLTYSATA